MDPLTAATLGATLVPLITGAAGEAGKSAWTSFASYIKGRFHREPAVVTTVEVLEKRPDDTDAVTQLAERVVAMARDDADLAAWLYAWHDKATDLTTNLANNSVSGTVHGNVVQGNVFGSITFGSPQAP